MQIDLTQKTAVVTGSTAGIGLAIAQGLAGAGAAVTVNGRTQERVEQALAHLRATLPAGELNGIAADAGGAEGCADLVAAVPAPDIVIHNVGIFTEQDFFDADDDDWQRYWDVNVMSGVRLSRAWLPGMAERGWGRVIFVSSESALNIPVDMIHYGVSKTAYLALSRGLAKRMAGTGVTVNAVLPGPTLSESVVAELEAEHGASGRPLEELAAEMTLAERPTSIIRRAATVEEVAHLVVYTASPLSSATTGAALRVDGGVVDTIA